MDAEGLVEGGIRLGQVLDCPEAELGLGRTHCIGEPAGGSAHDVL
ncbi:hypothetical protein [Ollibium composti]|nr:hypothetical protein [Mesorhizobium composti]